MTQPSILLEIDQGVALLTLNRPDNLNSFNVEMHERMRDAISTVRKDESVRVLVITGSGRLDLDGVIPQKQRQHGEDDKNDWPIIEDQPFEKGFGLGRGQIVLALVMLRVGHSKAPLLFVRLLPHQGVIEGFFHGRL